MPPDGRLPAAVITDFEHWIKIGMPDPRSGPSAVASDGIEIEQGGAHWSFQPVRRVEPPQVVDTAWLYGAVDRFVLAKLEQHRLQPAADAGDVGGRHRYGLLLGHAYGNGLEIGKES